MKKVLLVIVIVVALGAAGWGMWNARRHATRKVNATSPATILQQARRARDERRLYDLQTLRSALETYRGAYGRYPTQLGELAASFLPNIPVDPLTTLAYPYFATGVNPSHYSIIYTLEVGAQNIAAGQHQATPAGLAAP